MKRPATARRIFPLLLSALIPDAIEGQRSPDPAAVKDTVVEAFGGYSASALFRWLFGDNYRDEWTTPIRAPIIDLRSYAGGIRPFRIGGGQATRTLRFVGPDSALYVFRPAHKSVVDLPQRFQNTLIWKLYLDARSSIYPTAPLGPASSLAALGVLHPTPRLVVLPNDATLGQYQKEFGGLLGTIEEYPDVTRQGVAYAGAREMLDDDELLIAINKDPAEQVDARAYLTAHLVDMLFGDADRHSGQWKWARMRDGGKLTPIPRDRDWTFTSRDGVVAKVARLIHPAIVKFESTYVAPNARFHNAIEFDRRLLSGLDRRTWDSVASHVQATLTNSVLEAGMRSMPREYAASNAILLEKLKYRRDHLRQAADEYYLYLAEVVDLHATDSAERAMIVRNTDGSVDVGIESGRVGRWFSRRFQPTETKEIRLYLHGGDDHAVVVGNTAASIPLRIIGGNGVNTLVDSSIVGGKRQQTRLYDVGAVSGIVYDSDARIKMLSSAGSDELPYNRRPWLPVYGKVRPQGRDRGTGMAPIFGFNSGHGLGVVPRIGVAYTTYGFRHVPYASMVSGEVAYSTTNRWEVVTAYDKRRESSGVHAQLLGVMSELGVVEFHGFGNDVRDFQGDFFEVRERQWSLRPAIGYSFGPKSDVTLGPILRHTTTDSVANRFIAHLQPTGFPSMSQLGVSLELKYDSRNIVDTSKIRSAIQLDDPESPPLWGTARMSASAFPSTWDTESAYQNLAAAAAGYVTIPALTKPVLALRAGAQKVFGDFPYFDAAFLGGGRSLRTEHRQRYAGDAMVNFGAELRVPIAQVPFILPLDIGALGFVDAGRVWADGESPGGWHKGYGAGGWIGAVRRDFNLNLVVTNNPDRRVITQLGFTF
jgi:hypothetical protein